MAVAYIYNQNKKSLCNIIKTEKFDNNYIYKLNNIKNKTIRKLDKKIKRKCINNIVASENIEKLLKGYDFITGKRLMSYMITDILEHIFKVQNKKMELEDIYISINEDKKIYLENIEILSNRFKTTNIITSNINKFHKIAEKISEKNESIIYVSNNKRKSLKRAKYVVNFDMNSEELQQYNINRNCIIVNLKDNSYIYNIYDGIVIHQIDIDFSEELIKYFSPIKEYFNKNLLYESIINSKLELEEIRKRMREDNVRILALLGNNGQIRIEELLKNLDKM